MGRLTVNGYLDATGTIVRKASVQKINNYSVSNIIKISY